MSPLLNFTSYFEEQRGKKGTFVFSISKSLLGFSHQDCMKRISMLIYSLYCRDMYGTKFAEILLVVVHYDPLERQRLCCREGYQGLAIRSG